MHSPSVLAPLLALASFLAMASALGADIRYVDASASASGDGTSWGSAWKTIGEALDARPPPGATVLIAPGLYQETLHVRGGGEVVVPASPVVSLAADGVVQFPPECDLSAVDLAAHPGEYTLHIYRSRRSNNGVYSLASLDKAARRARIHPADILPEPGAVGDGPGALSAAICRPVFYRAAAAPGNPNARVTVDPSADPRAGTVLYFDKGADANFFDGIDLRNSPNYGGAHLAQASYNVIQGANIHDHKATGILVEGTEERPACYNMFIGNKIWNTPFEGVYIGAGGQPRERNHAHHTHVIGNDISTRGAGGGALLENAVDVKEWNRYTVVEGNYIHDFDLCTVSNGAVDVRNGADHTWVYGNRFHNIGRKSRGVNYVVNVYPGSAGVEVFNNLIWRDRPESDGVFAISLDGTSSRGVLLAHNTVVRMSRGLLLQYHSKNGDGSDNGSLVRNNLFAEIADTLLEEWNWDGAKAGSFRLDRNLFPSDPGVPPYSSLHGAERFVNGGGGDFRLRPDSLSLDAGAAAPPLVPWDADGSPRDARPDIGAYERQPEQKDANFYVSPDGDDAADGSIAHPWRTIQRAADGLPPGGTAHIRAGVYKERVEVKKSGSAEAGPITLRSCEGETAVLDGSDAAMADGHCPLLSIVGQSHVTIKGMEFRNLSTGDRDCVPVGIWIAGASSHIQILGNTVHHIAHRGVGPRGGNAHAIAVYGTDGSSPARHIVISGNTVRDCALGWSEAVALNGNVEFFAVSGNTIHDNDNIGIDVIGGEGTAPANDQARSGVIQGNVVYNISSAKNPAYSGEGAAAGLYVDGGRDVVIERNRVFHCDFGIEVGCENPGRTAEGVIVRNNLVFWNSGAGIVFGGYDARGGKVKDCRFEHNTLYQNDTSASGAGEVAVQVASHNILSCNILCAGERNLLVSNFFKPDQSFENLFNHNLYYGHGGADAARFVWNGKEHTGFAAFQSASGQDADSVFADPAFAAPAAEPPDFRLAPGSPAIDAGDPGFVPAAGEMDFAGNPRVAGSRTDCGAFEASGQEPPPARRLLAVSASPPEGGSVSGGGSYPDGATAFLAASPSAGWRFVQWSGDLSGRENPASILMDSDKTVVAAFERDTRALRVAAGSLVSIMPADVSPGLRRFSRKPSVRAVYGNGKHKIMLDVMGRFPAESAAAVWKRGVALYKKSDYAGKALGETLAAAPMRPLAMDALHVSAPKDGVPDAALPWKVTFEPPRVSGISGEFGSPGAPLAVVGFFFGSAPPDVLVEYHPGGDSSMVAYKTCKIDRAASLSFHDAAGRPDRSCMVVLPEDAASGRELGHSRVVAEYPRLKAGDVPTGYVIVANRHGLGAMRVPPAAPREEALRPDF